MKDEEFQNNLETILEIFEKIGWEIKKQLNKTSYLSDFQEEKQYLTRDSEGGQDKYTINN